MTSDDSLPLVAIIGGAAGAVICLLLCAIAALVLWRDTGDADSDEMVVGDREMRIQRADTSSDFVSVASGRSGDANYGALQLSNSSSDNGYITLPAAANTAGVGENNYDRVPISDYDNADINTFRGRP